MTTFQSGSSESVLTNTYTVHIKVEMDGGLFLLIKNHCRYFDTNALEMSEVTAAVFMVGNSIGEMSSFFFCCCLKSI